VSMDAAFVRLREYSRRTRTPLRCVAQDVIDNQFDPPELSPRGSSRTHR
jgi:hypothetical protein